MADFKVVSVKFTEAQVSALLILLDQADLTSYPAALRIEMLGARSQLYVWQRAAWAEDASELGEGL